MTRLEDYWASQPPLVWIVLSVCIELLLAIIITGGYLIHLLRYSTTIFLKTNDFIPRNISDGLYKNYSLSS